MEKGWIDNDTFSFFVPAQIIKSKGNDKKTRRWLQGIASTDTRDLQGEVVSQSGIDLSYFLKHGYLNNDHKPGFSNKVGQPTEARITKNGLWIKGFLFENHKVADEIWELMNSLDATQADRKLGFSIQGKVKRRDGNTIKECWIQDVAITPAPVNTSTWAEIVKSLSAQKWDLNKSPVGGEQTLVTGNVPLHGANSVLVPESLESKEKDDREDTKKSLTYDEAVLFLEKDKNLPRETAENVAKAIFTILGE